MSAAIAPLRIHRDGTSGDLVLTTPTYRPRLVGPAPVLPRRVDLAPRSSGLPAYSRATPPPRWRHLCAQATPCQCGAPGPLRPHERPAAAAHPRTPAPRWRR